MLIGFKVILEASLSICGRCRSKSNIIFSIRSCFSRPWSGTSIKMLVAIIVFSIISRVWFLSYYPNSFYGFLITPWGVFRLGRIVCFAGERDKLEFLKADWTLYVSSIVICVLISIEFGLSMEGLYQARTTHFQTPIAVALGFFIWSLWSVPDSNWTARILSWSHSYS